MKVIFERRTSVAAVWARRFAIFSAVLFLTSGFGHRIGLVDTPAFFWLLGIICALAVVALFCSAVGLARLWQYGDRGGRSSVFAVLVAAIVLLPFGFAAFRAFTLPRLSDISTDVIEAPRFFAARQLRRPGMNRIGDLPAGLAALQSRAYPGVTGRRYVVPSEIVLEAIEAVLARKRWRVTRSAGEQLTAGEATIEAVALTPLIGFVSDVAIRLTDEGETSSYVDMRSNSRYGAHDIGDNAAKITSFLDALDAEVAARGTAAPPPEE